MRNKYAVCPCCDGNLIGGVLSWVFKCPSCRYEGSDLKPQNLSSKVSRLDEVAREQGLAALRKSNFRILLNKCTDYLKPAGRLLDIGCAHGWFMVAASEKGFSIDGIEPDADVARYAKESGNDVMVGLFPDILEGKRGNYDGIFFNDVFEHLISPKEILKAVNDKLSPTGKLVLVLPSSEGLIYKLAKLASKIGINSFYSRMWQKGMPSPHLHYFNQSNMEKLLLNNGFRINYIGQLDSVSYDGLYQRIKFQEDLNTVISILIYSGMVLLLPFLRLFTSDSMVIIAEVNND